MRILFSKILTIAFVLALAVAAQAADLPKLKVGYIFTTNHTPLMAAMGMGEKLTVDGMWMQPLVPKEKYQLMKNGKAVAVLDIVVIKSGSETATLFAQKQLDIGLASITAIMAGIDKNIPIKIVSPLVLASGGVVVSNDVPAKTWPEFIAYIKASSKPVNIGYHSPSSSPIIILESALKSEGISYGEASVKGNGGQSPSILCPLQEIASPMGIFEEIRRGFEIPFEQRRKRRSRTKASKDHTGQRRLSL